MSELPCRRRSSAPQRSSVRPVPALPLPPHRGSLSALSLPSSRCLSPLGHAPGQDHLLRPFEPTSSRIRPGTSSIHGAEARGLERERRGASGTAPAAPWKLERERGGDWGRDLGRRYEQRRQLWPVGIGGRVSEDDFVSLSFPIPLS
jgi:hypothetical protein